MRVLIVSDTHGRHTSLDRALKEAGDIALFAVAEYDAHAATHMSLWLAEDTDAGVVFLQRIEHIVV